MTLNEIRKNAGLEKKYLVEGIKYFKDSKRIEKYIKKIQKGNVDGSLNELTDKLRETAKDFQEVESLYEKGYKIKAKRLHQELKSNNKDLIKILNKETIKKSLINAGIAAVALHLLLTLTTGTGLFGTLFPKGGAGGETTGGVIPDDLSAERSQLSQTAKELERELKQTESRLGNLEDYEKALERIEKAEKAAQKRIRRAERAAERAARNL